MVLEENGNTHEELINLQNSCRNVSKAFKEEVEDIFVARHLPQTSIWLAQGAKGNLEDGDIHGDDAERLQDCCVYRRGIHDHPMNAY